ncbi:hypothetical protein WBG78_30755, partial [Chryseolinea sp. T2]|uniref:hypothetical protein n=1 Tax=Chryseolinea sp. T2 TaxID=3129255 RepID=UPI0030779A8A
SLDIICRSGNKKGLQTISWLELPTTLTYAPLLFTPNLTNKLQWRICGVVRILFYVHISVFQKGVDRLCVLANYIPIANGRVLTTFNRPTIIRSIANFHNQMSGIVCTSHSRRGGLH